MSTLEAGLELGNYKILHKLGSGGMADVYEAQDIKLGRHVALKLLPPDLSRDDNLRTRFEREVKQVAALNHRNIVTLFEFGDVPPYHFYTMRLLTGGDLRARIEKGLRPEEALWILRECSSAFEHAHSRGLVHRDVKPENIVFDENGIPVLTDFGIAKVMNSSTRMTKTGMSIGTPSYISPEQARGRDVDGRADLYSLGIIFYEMLTGDVPFKAEDSLAVVFKHMTEPIPELKGGLAAYQPIVMQLLAKDPDKRCATAADLIQLLDQFAADPNSVAREYLQSLERPRRVPSDSDGDSTVMNADVLGQHAGNDDVTVMNAGLPARSDSIDDEDDDADDTVMNANVLGRDQPDINLDGPLPAFHSPMHEARPAPQQSVRPQSAAQRSPAVPRPARQSVRPSAKEAAAAARSRVRANQAKPPGELEIPPRRRETPDSAPTRNAKRASTPAWVVNLVFGALVAVLIGGLMYFYLQQTA